MHLRIDKQKLDSRAHKFTDSNVGDVPMLPERLYQIPADQGLASVTADGTYDAHGCHLDIAQRGAAAIIPPHKYATPLNTAAAVATAPSEALLVSKVLGRALLRLWSSYHGRSRAETGMHCLNLPGQRVMALDFEPRMAEFKSVSLS